MKKPHWIQREHLFDPMEYVCSECGAAFDEPWEECPECGARMKKVKYDTILFFCFYVLSDQLQIYA